MRLVFIIIKINMARMMIKFIVSFCIVNVIFVYGGYFVICLVFFLWRWDFCYRGVLVFGFL